MKKALLIILLFFTITVFGQKRFTKFTMVTEHFFIKIDSNWVTIDTVGTFNRTIKINEKKNTLQLQMQGNKQEEIHKYTIDKIVNSEESLIYFCLEKEGFPLIVEIVDKTIGLYYFYDAATDTFEKSEKLFVLSRK
jgi:hypothetical protein